MGMVAAKQGDQIKAVDTHNILQPPSGTLVPTPHPFNGIIDGNLSPNVKIMGRAAATTGSTATNTPPHVPIGGTFQKPPTNRGTIQADRRTVFINGKPVARTGDKAMTCNDPTDALAGTVVAIGTVMIG